jgi:hypothetical protein
LAEPTKLVDRDAKLLGGLGLGGGGLVTVEARLDPLQAPPSLAADAADDEEKAA